MRDWRPRGFKYELDRHSIENGCMYDGVCYGKVFPKKPAHASYVPLTLHVPPIPHMPHGTHVTRRGSGPRSPDSREAQP